jgi:hypothetical protein
MAERQETFNFRYDHIGKMESSIQLIFKVLTCTLGLNRIRNGAGGQRYEELSCFSHTMVCLMIISVLVLQGGSREVLVA